MNAYNPGRYDAYRQTQVQTASPTELVVMLYRGAIRFTKAGIDGVNRGDIQAAHAGFVRAQQIVTELSATLNLERGGELARQLRTIYTFVSDLLMKANIRKAVEPAMHVVRLLEELLSAWEQIRTPEAAKAQATFRAA
jgi:flagellar secretion chaperone FliS